MSRVKLSLVDIERERGMLGERLDLMLETRGPEDSEKLIKAIRSQVAKLEILH